MRHEHQVDWRETLDLDRVDAVNTSQERGFILFQVPEVWSGHFSQEEILLLSRHGFDDEAFVRAEEEKAS